jgi:hypothetical protein
MTTFEEQVLQEFDDRFVKKIVKRVDAGNSIELPLWKNNHSHLSRDVKDFLLSALAKQREEIVKRIKQIDEVEMLKGEDNTIFNAGSFNLILKDQAIEEVGKV